MTIDELEIERIDDDVDEPKIEPIENEDPETISKLIDLFLRETHRKAAQCTAVSDLMRTPWVITSEVPKNKGCDLGALLRSLHEYRSSFTTCKEKHGCLDAWSEPWNPLGPALERAKARARCEELAAHGLYSQAEKCFKEIPPVIPVETFSNGNDSNEDDSSEGASGGAGGIQGSGNSSDGSWLLPPWLSRPAQP